MESGRQLEGLEFGSSAPTQKPGTIPDVYNPNTGGVGAETGVYQELTGWPTSLDDLSSKETPWHGLRLGWDSSQAPSLYSPLLDLV